MPLDQFDQNGNIHVVAGGGMMQAIQGASILE